SGSAVEIDQIVTSSHIAGDVREYLACELEADIVMVNDVALDDDAGAAVDVDTVGTVSVAREVGRIVAVVDIVDQVAADVSVACLVVSHVWRGALETDRVN